MTVRDPELLELLADKPELLAVADAVAATQKPPKRSLVRRPVTRFAAVAALAAAAVAALLVLPQGGPGIVDRAIAAIGNGRVLHIVIDSPTGTTYVNLANGHRTVEHYQVELWADQKLDRLHAIMTFHGKVAVNLLWPQDKKYGATVGPVDPAFTALWSGYRDALANGEATRAGEGNAFGHRVYWLRFRPVNHNSPGSEVAVDAKTFKPIVWRSYNGVQATDGHILLAVTTNLAAADFTRRGPPSSQLLAGSVTSSGGGSSGSILGGPNTKPNTNVPAGWLSPGDEVDGQKLAAVLPQTITTAKKKTIHSIQLVYGRLQYGTAAQDATTIDELPQADDPQMWAHIPAGAIELEKAQTGGSGGAHLEWIGYLIKDGHYLTITSLHGEQAVIRIARSLRPVK